MTRPNVASFHCLNNLKQLTFGWRMYADDHQGKLVVNADGPSAGQSGASPSWAGGYLDYSTSSDNINTDLLLNHARYPFGAFLGPYLKTAAVFKCPADSSVVEIRGQQIPRVRSVSLNSYLGGCRTWSGSTSKYPLRARITEIKSPARIFTFLHEREDSINDPLFWTDPDRVYRMIDYPGSSHDGAGSFAFVDGHCEMHRWLDPRTMPVLTPGKWIPLNVSIPGDVDIDWLNQHAAE